MTNREFYNAVIASDVVEELKEYAREAIAKLDKRNEARSSKPSKVALANEPIKASILEYVAEHANAVAADIAEACEISTQKASSLCRQLVESGKMISAEVKVPKKGKVKAYSIAE